MAPTIEHLLESITEICMLGDQIENRHAESFIQDFSLDFIFSIFQSDSVRITEEQMEMVVTALSYVLLTQVGKNLLPEMVYFAPAALSLPNLSVKKLTVQQIAHVLQLEIGERVYAMALEFLFKALQAKETEIGMAASNALLNHMNKLSTDSLRALLRSQQELLSKLATSNEHVIQARVLELILNLSAASHEACEMLRTEGLLEIWTRQLFNFQDPLGCLAVWNLFVHALLSTFSDSARNTVPILLQALLPNVQDLVDSFFRLDGYLKSGLLPCFSIILTLSYDEQNPQHLSAFTIFLEELRNSLDSGGEEWLMLVLDALGLFGKSSKATQMMILHDCQLFEFLVKMAVGHGTGLEHRASALRSLSSLCLSSFTSNPNPSVEEKLPRIILHEVGVDGFENFLYARLKGPVQDLRPSLYHLMISLSGRLWFVCGVCSYLPLLEHITNAMSESDKELCILRFQTIERLSESITRFVGMESVNHEEKNALQLAQPRIAIAMEAGPYGIGNLENQSIPIVATERR